MSKIYCAKDGIGEIIKGSLGFYAKADLENLFPDDTIVELTDAEIPKGYVQGHYKIISDGDSFRFKRKTQVERDAVDQTISDSNKVPNIDNLLVIDATQETGTLKIVVEFLQGIYG